jgi:hypothetical protein
MLLQELKRDTTTLLNTTGATREELETFLKVTNTDLGEILYSQSKYNQFVKWLEHHKEIETGLLFVNIAMVNYLIDKHEKGQQYTTSEKMNCYAFDKSNNQYIFCENKNGICRTYGIVL